MAEDPQDVLAIMATEQDALRARVRAAAQKAGVGTAEMMALLTEFSRLEPEPIQLCGYAQKGTGLTCTRPAHPDEPGNREPHAAKIDGQPVISWPGALTYPEQLAAEKDSGAASCGAGHPGWPKVRCERSSGHKGEHLAQGPIVSQGKDGKTELHSWS